MRWPNAICRETFCDIEPDRFTYRMDVSTDGGNNYIIANHWWIQEEHKYFDTGTPTPWVKANFLAEHVLGEPWELRLSTGPAVLGEKGALRLLSRRQSELRLTQLGMSEATLLSQNVSLARWPPNRSEGPRCAWTCRSNTPR